MKVSIVHPDQRRKISIRTAKMVEENSKKKGQTKAEVQEETGERTPETIKSHQGKVFAEEGRFCFLLIDLAISVRNFDMGGQTKKQGE